MHMAVQHAAVGMLGQGVRVRYSQGSNAQCVYSAVQMIAQEVPGQPGLECVQAQPALAPGDVLRGFTMEGIVVDGLYGTWVFRITLTQG